MAVEWFAQTDEGAIGPMTPARLRAAVAAGRITPETKVRRADMQKWMRCGRTTSFEESRSRIRKADAAHFTDSAWPFSTRTSFCTWTD